MKPWERNWGAPVSPTDKSAPTEITVTPPAPAVTTKPWERKWNETAPVSTPEVAPEPVPPVTDRRRGTIVSPIMQGLTLGFGDEMEGAIRAPLAMIREGKGLGEAYTTERDASRQRLADAREDYPWGSVAAEVGGSILPMLMTGGAGLAARGVTAGARLAQGAIQGAGTGAAYGFGASEGELGGQVKDAVVGGILGGATGAGATAIANRWATRAGRKAIPSTAEVKSSAKAAYARADNSGVILDNNAVQRMQGDLVQELTDFGYSPRVETHRAIRDTLGELQHVGRNPVTWRHMENVRHLANEAAKQPGRAGEIGRRMLNRVDDYMSNVPRSDVIAGNIDEAMQGTREGRQLWARQRRSQMVDDAFLKAERRTQSTGTGSNIDNVTRQTLRPILDRPNMSRGMTPGELAQTDKVVRGSWAGNKARTIGRMAPTGTLSNLNLMASGGAAGYMLGSPLLGAGVMGAMGVGGAAARRYADSVTKRGAQRLSETIRSGGMNAEELVQAARRGAPVNPRLIQDLTRQAGIERRAVPAVVAGREASVQSILGMGDPAMPKREKRYR